MDYQPRHNDPVLAALRTLYQASDADLQRYPQLADMVGRRILQAAGSQSTQIPNTVQPKGPRSSNQTAQSLLQFVATQLGGLKAFLGKDQTRSIRTTRFLPACNSGVASFSETADQDLLSLLPRALDTRSLVWEYRGHYMPKILQASIDDIPDRLLSQQSRIKSFILGRGLPHQPTYKALKDGQKLWYIERKTNRPGIWLVLMLILPKLAHTPDHEVDAMVVMLMSRTYESVLQLALALTDYTLLCQEERNCVIGSLVS